MSATAVKRLELAVKSFAATVDRVTARTEGFLVGQGVDQAFIIEDNLTHVLEEVASRNRVTAAK